MILVCDKEGNAIDALYLDVANSLETGFAETIIMTSMRRTI